MQTLASISWLIPLLPLVAAAVAGFAGKRILGGRSHWPIWIGVGGSAVLSLALLFTMLAASPNQSLAFTDDYETVVANKPEIIGKKDKADEDHGDEAHSDDESHAGDEPHAHDDHAHHGPDGDVKLLRSHWFTWIAAGDDTSKNVPPSLTEAQVVELALSRGEAGVLPDQLPDVTQVGSDGRTSGYFEVVAGALLDPLSVVMLSVVCGIGFLITIFAAGYMKGETGYWRFFAYLGLFLFSMTCLVMGENLIMLYLGWEGVGLCSYLLIGYYFDKPAAREAAKKAFLVNRVGDFGFAIGIMLVWWCFGTVSYFGDGGVFGDGFVEMATNPHAFVPVERQWALDWIPFALMLGAFGKSAQFPLYVWLPDAMEGPTPVSALIHAATMVTAGVYMIARLGPVFAGSPAALVTITVVGTFTALFAATIALRQFDLKKVFAYSTVSQLGYMFVAVGVLAPMAGVFHLVTHAFFKALLFLSSGVVMHAMLGHLDMRKMSGLKTVLPKTRILCLIGCAALAGFPATAGFFSKDEIIHFAKYHATGDWVGWLLYALLLLTAFLTAFYTFRLYFRVFEGPTVVPTEPAPGHHHDDHGTNHADAAHGATPDAHAADHGHDDHHHDHEPPVMMVPLILLAVGAILAGWLQFPLHWLGSFLGDSASFFYAWDMAVQKFGPNESYPVAGAFGYETKSFWAYIASVAPGLLIGSVIAVSGIGLAYLLHLKDRDKAVGLAHTFRPFVRLFDGKYFVDEIYNAAVVGTLRATGKILWGIDTLLDMTVNGFGHVAAQGGALTRVATQRGALQGYAVGMLLGVAVIVAAIAIF